MTFLNMQLIKNTCHNYYEFAKIIKSCHFQICNQQKTCHHDYCYDIINPSK